MLDLNLPDGLGTELLARIRAEYGRRLVVVIASGSDPERDTMVIVVGQQGADHAVVRDGLSS